MMVQHCKTIHKFKKKQTLRIWGYQLKYVIAMLGLFFSTAVNALSIGHARAESSRQEPLQFSVLIKKVTKDVYEHLSVEIAPPSAWQELGLTPIDGVMNANVQLKEGHSSNTVVARFYGVQPVDEAVIDAIIDIALGNQQQRHQVSMLQQPQPKVHLPTQRKSEHFEYGQQPITPDSQAADIVVQPGDTLHSIAQRIGTDAGTEFQVLAALYEINPKAFSQKNMNFLYAGEVLKRPTEQQIQRLTDQQAREIYLEHLARFNQYKEALARGAVEDEAAEILTMPSAVDDPSESLAKEQPE